MGRVAGRDEVLLSFGGQWALFKFFHQATDWRESGRRHRVIWDIAWQGETLRVEAEVSFTGPEPIVDRAYFPATVCPSPAFSR